MKPSESALVVSALFLILSEVQSTNVAAGFALSLGYAFVGSLFGFIGLLRVIENK